MLQNLTHNTTYLLRVVASNQQGKSPESKTITVSTPDGRCPAVEKLKVISELPYSAVLSWQEPKDPITYPSTTGDKDTAVPTVEVTTDTSSDDACVWTPTPAVMKSEERKWSATVSNLLPATTYKTRVMLVNSYGGTPCKSMSIQTPSGLPSVPEQLTVTKVQPTSLTIEWTDGSVLPGQDPEAVTTFRVESSIRDKIWIPVTGTYTITTTPTDSKKKKKSDNVYTMVVGTLTPKTLYGLRVCAINKYGESSPCKSLSCETSTGLPSKPTSLVVGEVTDTTAQILWIEGPLVKDQDASVEIGYKCDVIQIKTDLDDLLASRGVDALMSKKTKKEADKLTNDKSKTPNTASTPAPTTAFDVKLATQEQMETYYKGVSTTSKVYSGVISMLVPLKMFEFKISATNVFGDSAPAEGHQVCMCIL